MIRNGLKGFGGIGWCRRMSQNSCFLSHRRNRFLRQYRVLVNANMYYSGENRLGGEESPYLKEHARESNSLVCLEG